jgi:hypothetical protein
MSIVPQLRHLSSKKANWKSAPRALPGQGSVPYLSMDRHEVGVRGEETEGEKTTDQERAGPGISVSAIFRESLSLPLLSEWGNSENGKLVLTKNPAETE